MGGFAGVFGGELAVGRRLARPLDARGPAARWEAAAPGAAMVVVESGAPSAASAVGVAEGVLAAVDGPVPSLRALAAELEIDADTGAGTIFAALVARTGFVRAVQRLPADVAAAAWDVARQTGWVARDRSGLRPLAVAVTPGGAAFATEARALALTGFAGGPTAAALAQAVALGAPAPPRALPAGARALAPGEIVEVARGALRVLAAPTAPAHAGGERGNVERWRRSVGYGVELAWGWRARAAAPNVLAVGGGLASAALLALRPRDAGPAVALTLRLPWGVEPDVVERVRAAGLGLVEVPFDASVCAELADELAPSPAWLRPEAWAWAALGRAAWREGAVGLVSGVGARHGLDPAVPGPLGGRGAPLLARLRAGAPEWALAERYGAPMAGDDAAVADLAALPERARGEPAAWLARQVGLPEVELAAVDAGVAAWGVSHVAPFADAAVLEVACQVPPAALHAGGRRALLASLSGAPPGAPRDWPWFDPSFLEAVPLDGLEGALADRLDPAHVRAVVAAARAGEDRAVRRAFALGMIARGLAG